METEIQSPQTPTCALQAVILDLDGTLLDTAPDLASAVDAMMVDLGRDPCGVEQVRGWVGQGVPKLVERALRYRLGQAPTPEQQEEAIELFIMHYTRTNGETSRPYPGVLEGLEALRELGIALGCVTNKPRRFTVPLLERLELLQWFGAVTSGDDLPHKKPHPMPLIETARRLGVHPQAALMVGDSETDVGAARSAEMRVVLVSYGYNGGRDPRTLGADGVVDSVAEIPPLMATLSSGLS